MADSKGNVEAIGTSGSVWAGFRSVNIKDLFFDTLKSATTSVQISSYAMGRKNEEMKEFFSIIEGLLESPHMKINIIVNDDGRGSTSRYAMGRLDRLAKKYPEQFFPQLFESKPDAGLGKILHAKLTVVDGTTALVGSANISKSALESNYEIMLKVTGHAAADIAAMLVKLSNKLREKKV